MKNILAAIFLLTMFSGSAQTYNITSNSNWSTVISGDCWNCTINISTGVTFTLNTNKTCGSCIITGGTITMSSNFTMQQPIVNNTTINVPGITLNLQNNGSSFTNTIVNATGASKFIATGSVNMAGSTFNFSGTSEFRNSGGTLNVSNSRLYFYGNSFFNATAGPVNLSASSQMVAGDGSVGSAAYLLFNGPALKLVDAGSAFYVANKNNYYYNWSAYTSQSNSTTYTTTSNNKNCGGAGQNACQAQYFYGCASFGNLGAVTCTTLAYSLSNFKVVFTGDEVKLNWSVSGNVQNGFFKVERSVNNNVFTPLTTMESGAEGSYAFTDANPEKGENNYRISLVGQDGQISYSKIISVQNTVSANISIFPNPASGGRFHIQMPSAESATLTVYSMEGQLLYMRPLNGQMKYDISLSSAIRKQMLVVRIVTNERTSSFNLLNLP